MLQRDQTRTQVWRQPHRFRFAAAPHRRNDLHHQSRIRFGRFRDRRQFFRIVHRAVDVGRNVVQGDGDGAADFVLPVWRAVGHFVHHLTNDATEDVVVIFSAAVGAGPGRGDSVESSLDKLQKRFAVEGIIRFHRRSIAGVFLRRVEASCRWNRSECRIGD